MRRINCWILMCLSVLQLWGQDVYQERKYIDILNSVEQHGGSYEWKMKKAKDVSVKIEDISTLKVETADWMSAIVPGTVLNSLVYNQVYPEPYWGLNNKLTTGLIPDLNDVGRDFYTYWFRTEFKLNTKDHTGRRTWLQVDGINYRAELWLNGNLIGNLAGMFKQKAIDITDYIVFDEKNVLAIKTIPVDNAGTIMPKGGKSWGATGEYQNGGNGEIGKNVTMLMTVGWDFTFSDGIRDRNTGIWKELSLFTTGELKLAHPFVKSELAHPNYDEARETISVEVNNAGYKTQHIKVIGEIKGENIRFEKKLKLYRGITEEVVFTPEEYPQLVMKNPRLWWPIHKGEQNLYEVMFKIEQEGALVDSITSRFGIRELISDTNSPDGSRSFYINGKPLFIKGSNWLPENMLRTSPERTYAELRYTAQAGVNLLRLWAGGITESDYFYQLCDELGILVWTEFWMTGDTKHPDDEGMHSDNMISTIKRIRNHPSLAYYVCSNETTETQYAERVVKTMDGTRGYQMQSECCGIHDGSPYKQVNIMCHYENTASDRGSRIDGFNPEYGSPCLPTVECLREMMSEKDLWPMNKEVWDYSDGNGFHLMSTLYKDMVDEYGESHSIDEFARKGQFVGAFNYKSIWEVWNYNKSNYGDRYCAGFLFWYHNCPIRQVCARMWDWSLEPTAALYAAQNACEPLHPQFDYLKNTVSVVNDYYQSFAGYKVKAEVYDLNMKKVFSHQATVDLPEDGVVNDIFEIEFPETLTNVHFIKLYLHDDKNVLVGSNFYWRSNSKYEGRKTLTGPTTGGFQDINKLASTKIKTGYKIRREQGKHFIDVTLKNTGKSLSFFTQLQWLDGEGKPVRPSFYTDNFMSLLPGENACVTIETDMKKLTKGEIYTLVIKGFNIDAQKIKITI